jgi:hypothetical protein
MQEKMILTSMPSEKDYLANSALTFIAFTFIS